jgi:tripartite-type tricarboxylate transporter receptor subunit TctC
MKKIDAARQYFRLPIVSKFHPMPQKMRRGRGNFMIRKVAFKLVWAVVAVCAVAVGHLRAAAAEYPTKPIRVIVPYAAGSASDVVTRIMLSEMSESLGQPLINDNQPGAGGDSGTAAATRAAPDGYTLIVTGVGPLAANRSLFKKIGYDAEKDFAPISQFVVLPNVIVINAKLPPKTLLEFVDYAKAHPKALNYGTVGFGSSQHLAALYFEQVVGVELTHVPYRQFSQFTPDFIAGQVPLGFQLLPNVLGLLSSGDARALAVTSRTRLSALPDVPTAAEAGVKNYETVGWLAMLAPVGTPKPVIDKVYEALANAMKKQTVKARYAELGAEPVAPGPEELTKLIVSETTKWQKTIERAGLQPM